MTASSRRSASPAPLHGIWRIIPSPMLTEVLAQGGLDFQILDCEHGAYDYATLLPDILACERHDCAPFIRVSGHDKVEVQRCLDLGARGLVFPQLTGPGDFARAAAMMDYAPAGTRGFNPFVRAGRYGASSPPAPRAWFVPIVETLEAAQQIETILQIGRIDLVYVGVYDLSAQLGAPGQLDSPDLIALVDRILDACAAANKPVGLMAVSTAAAERLVNRGVRAIVHGVESHRLAQAMREIVSPVVNYTPSGIPNP
jgi:2,4-dihydroxyhept-2-ene-1,7-dioic acid aldolase